MSETQARIVLGGLINRIERNWEYDTFQGRRIEAIEGQPSVGGFAIKKKDSKNKENPAFKRVFENPELTGNIFGYAFETGAQRVDLEREPFFQFQRQLLLRRHMPKVYKPVIEYNRQFPVPTEEQKKKATKEKEKKAKQKKYALRRL